MNTIEETLTTEQLEALTDIGQSTEARAKRVVHIGPETPDTLEITLDMSKTAVLDEKVIETVRNIVADDVQHDHVNLRALGHFVFNGLALVEGSKKDDHGASFCELLGRFYDNPADIVPEVTYAVVDGNRVPEYHTSRERLAHALYHAWPNMLEPNSGGNRQTAASRRLSNALDRYKKHADETAMEFSIANAARMAQENPEIEESEAGKAIAKAIADADALAKAAKAALPRTARDLYYKQYQACVSRRAELSDDDNARKTLENRVFLNSLMTMLNYTADTLREWQVAKATK